MYKKQAGFTIDLEAYTKFKMICVERNTTVPKVITKLINEFIAHDKILKRNKKPE